MAETSPANTTAADANVKRRPNVALWLGFLLSVVAFLSYVPVFARYPITRDMPWANFLLFGLALIFLFVGLRRAFAQPGVYRGKILGPILATLSGAGLAFFCLLIFSLSKRLPPSIQAPKVGQKAPDFALPDTNGATVSLASLLSTNDPSHPTKGVVLIFYRGYW
jgi:AhpC/TSA family